MIRRALTLARDVTRDLASFMNGYVVYRRRGETPNPAYASMRRLYCHTNGRFNDATAVVAGLVHRPVRDPTCAGVLGPQPPAALERAVSALRRDGYHVFDARLPRADVEALVQLGHALPCTPMRPYSAAPAAPGRYLELRGTSNRYDFAAVDLCAHRPVQQLLADASIRAVAASYLGCEPILDLVTMWWSEPSPPVLDLASEAAQLFHFDMDRLKFIKFFIYLTDVDHDTGPHCLVRRSHVRKPRALLRDGRHSDASITASYPDDVVQVCGPAGTILAVDTRAFHKGTPLVRGARLLFQLEFAISAFGQVYPRVPLSTTTSDLDDAMRRHPRTFKLFDRA